MQGPADLEQAFRAAREEHAEALIVADYGFLNSHRERILQLVDTIRLPVMYTNIAFVKLGGLMSYAEDRLDRARRAATFVDKILNSPPYTFFLLNGDMELYRNRHLFI
jgi:ABC-type uncharacterized transport system substrate-binding protein